MESLRAYCASGLCPSQMRLFACWIDVTSIELPFAPSEYSWTYCSGVVKLVWMKAHGAMDRMDGNVQADFVASLAQKVAQRLFYPGSRASLDSG